MGDRGIINGYDVGKALRAAGYKGPVVVTAEGFRAGTATYERWAEVQAAFPTTTVWVTPKGAATAGVWVDKAAVGYATELRFDRTGKPVPFVEGVPCERMSSTGGGWGWSTCGKRSDGTTADESPLGFGVKDGEAPIFLCPFHASVVRRVQANDARRHQEAEARRERDDHAVQLRQASVEWAQRLAGEYGVQAHPHYARSREDQLLVEAQPEHLYALLSAAAGMLRDVGVSWEDVRAEVAG